MNRCLFCGVADRMVDGDAHPRCRSSYETAVAALAGRAVHGETIPFARFEAVEALMYLLTGRPQPARSPA